MQEIRPRKLRLRAFAPGRRRDGLGDTVRIEKVEQLIEAGLARDRFNARDRVVAGDPRRHQRLGALLASVMACEQRDAVGAIAADHGLTKREIEPAIVRRSDGLPCALPDRFGVQHQAVHVENDGCRHARHLRNATHVGLLQRLPYSSRPRRIR